MVASFRSHEAPAREGGVAPQGHPRTTAHIADYVQTSGTARGTLVAFPGRPAGAIPDTIVRCVLRRGDSPHTRAAYEADIRTYADWLEGEGLAWDAVSPDDLDRYRDALSGRYARTTSNRHLSTLRSLYREGLRAGLIVSDPASDVRSVRGRVSVTVVSSAPRKLDASSTASETTCAVRPDASWPGATSSSSASSSERASDAVRRRASASATSVTCRDTTSSRSGARDASAGR